ncbi:hypothetical protein GUITHDRAFT_135583 [Guillardia theta CCMP2712]|uniref:Uncharacterized protein n=1 Tax=Guillardia theta (strain CCMP2712) TaxID=905079 RepID=L1JMS4_GUITC|nr:hypothetical protein GUITHDRAFT_135583 [Guillardia theta CCMP2712]EKX49886.1 hypothetical protein GUITHDRAFT_135583 [Guillardia theta CCMP2712]|mmetsp:Transcript_18412/g.60457  ORF Transcript_18412/g.60457 Transcript_18412/m.60457 type:complete len:345 (-) Transcript_18412:83-1117(-)|eukprot:XP_005836866.1 hypothetical protein GUITHDRAFT_135583 [Guillardia theta CCMP2712]
MIDSIHQPETVGHDSERENSLQAKISIPEDFEKILCDLRNPKFYLHNPTFKQLLRVPAEYVVDRTMAMYSNVNLMAALILSGVTSVSLTPVDVSSISADKRTLANCFNLLAELCMTINALNVMFTTYILLAIAAEMPSTLYGILSKSEGLTMIYFVSTFLSCVLLVALGVLAQWLRDDAWAAWTATIATGAIFLTTVLHFGYTMSVLMPIQYSGWGMFSTLGLFWGKEAKAEAARQGRIIASEAESHLHVKKDHREGVRDEKLDEVVADLTKLLHRALPEAAEERISHISQQMANEGLVVVVLANAARKDAKLIYQVLGGDDVNFELRRGERLAVINELLEQDI